MEPFPFQELPAELQVKVITTRPNLLSAWSQTNSIVRDLSLPEYRSLCQISIKASEVRTLLKSGNISFSVYRNTASRTYMDFDENVIGIISSFNCYTVIISQQRITMSSTEYVEFVTADPVDDIFAIMSTDLPMVNTPQELLDNVADLTSIIFGLDSGVTFGHVIWQDLQFRAWYNKDLHYGGAESNLTLNLDGSLDPVELDFVSQYKILQQRIQCVKLYPDYARHNIINKIKSLAETSDRGQLKDVFYIMMRLVNELTIVNALNKLPELTWPQTIITFRSDGRIATSNSNTQFLQQQQWNRDACQILIDIYQNMS